MGVSVIKSANLDNGGRVQMEHVEGAWFVVVFTATERHIAFHCLSQEHAQELFDAMSGALEAM
jgi:hypothetical protein